MTTINCASTPHSRSAASAWALWQARPHYVGFEQQQDRSVAIGLHKMLLDQFVARHKTPPKRLVLDFDATDIPVYGEQELRFFHGYYDSYCFWAILALLVKALRQEWPKVKIVFREDSGFCRHRILDWCRRNNVKYIVGIARNKRLERKLSGYLELARRYCARDDRENPIKDQQVDLFAGRTSCHRWWPNQWRLLLSALAWVLYEYLHEQLRDTKLAKASAATLRNRLIKVGAVAIKNTGRFRFLLPTSLPDREIFHKLATHLEPT